MGDLTTQPTEPGLSQWLSSNKDLLIFLPILGSALAITYDVGYFFGIGIGSFTVFSISEHVTFALQALPVGLIVAMLVFAAPFLIKAQDRGSTAAKSNPLVAGLVILAYLGVLAYAIWVGNPFFVAGLFTGAVVHILTIFLARRRQPAIAIGWATIGALSVAFAVGLASAWKDWSRREYQSTITIKSGPEIKANIVRSGERGLLFFVQGSNELQLFPWDEIKMIRWN